MATRNALATAEASQSPLIHRFSARAARRPIKILGAVPVVRHAVLVKHDPPLRATNARTAASAMKQSWPRWQQTYLEKVAALAVVDASELQFVEGETVRYRYDGDTPMIDLPRVRARAGVKPAFDQRNCAALCIKQYSSKFWTRIGLPENSTGYKLDEVCAITSQYREQAQICSDWFYEQFISIAHSAVARHKQIVNHARLEVTTIGLRIDDVYTEDELESWIWNGDAANFENEELCEYLAAAADIDAEDVPLIGDTDPKTNYWLSVPGTILTARGILVSRRALYMSRTEGNVLQFVGIGFDDSARGDLANDVALKLSRFIAHGI